ncbi:MAG: DUF4417 domain-containing protein [Desulfobacteraceae bacterium]|nr:DUF4417 domain-containing protein [Desulfobacteraceae bacterium]
MHNIKCNVCGNTFEARRSDARYCSVKCKNSNKSVKNFSVDIFNSNKFSFPSSSYYDIPDLIPQEFTSEFLSHERMTVSFRDRNKHDYNICSIIDMYTDDYVIEPVWKSPDLYIDSLSKFFCIIGPDFTFDNRSVEIFNLYRKRCIERFFQGSGLKVIPCIRWFDLSSFNYCLDGLFKEGIYSFRFPSVNEFSVNEFRTAVDIISEELSPALCVVFGSKKVFSSFGNFPFNVIRYSFNGGSSYPKK